MNEVLTVKDLSFDFGRRHRVLRGLDLQLAPGKVTVLLGSNGAGKSTLLRLLLGVLRPAAGTVRLLGQDPLGAHRAVLERVGYVPDTPDVYPWMTPRELFLFLQPHYPRWHAQRCAELAERLAVPMTTKFRALSRGQGMKAMLVAALATEPDLLLLDEPFAGLDPLVREEVLQGLVAELRDGERTVLCATHELEIAARIADRIAVLHDGRIVRHGELAEVLDATEEPAQVPNGLHRLLAEATAPAPTRPAEVTA
jgi:ABC-2 type transport system ATP-binding protein